MITRVELTMEQLDTLEEEPGVADLMDVMEELMEVLERMELCIMEELVLETLSLVQNHWPTRENKEHTGSHGSHP